mmetsp:Transcript_10236/g.11242  ORF Transcript_10236/g.11242 Transcript_10236/m.11242 type:complete len:248 (+) Transcript_10236:194-937(+)
MGHVVPVSTGASTLPVGRGPLLLLGHNRHMLRLLLLHDLLRVAPEEGIHHHVPRLGARNGAAEVQHLTCQEPVEQRDGLLALVVGWDDHVHVLQGRVCVAKGNHRDRGVGSLLDGLLIGARIRHNQQARLQVLGRDLVGQGSWHPATGQRIRARVLAELEHSAGAVRTLRGHDDVTGVLDGHDNACRHLDLLPGLAQVDDVNAIHGAAEDIALHAIVDVACAQVGLTHQHHLHIFLFARHGDAVKSL